MQTEFSLDMFALQHAKARQLIRYATPDEQKQYRALYPEIKFTVLPAVVTLSDDGVSLAYRFWPFVVPDGVLPILPNSPYEIADIDAGRGVVLQTPRGYELRGYQAS